LDSSSKWSAQDVTCTPPEGAGKQYYIQRHILLLAKEEYEQCPGLGDLDAG
jgi:hypothetical protein